ncbi:hypothetical protein HYT02_05500 [Candidatus Gottesmanbacteria bacterium]|nr:hypothetical protein [Candidatus Gottesmanbacteria bacterium]
MSIITSKYLIIIRFLDGEKPKWYERKLKKVLRDKGIQIKKLRSVRRQSNVGIQLADCLAGLTRYYYDNMEAVDAKKWFNKLKRDKKLTAQFIFETETVNKLLSSNKQKTPPKR